MNKKNPLKDAIGEAGGSARTNPIASAAMSKGNGATLAPVTGRYPTEVRNQLKALAAERGISLQALMAEAFNDLFAKYGKPEIVPTSTRQS